MLASCESATEVVKSAATTLASQPCCHEPEGLTVQLSFIERMAVRLLLRSKLSELHENAFEQFFHELMCVKYSDFVNIRTAGSLGDLSSDGLRLCDRQLYACYGPRVFDADKVIKKFNSDLGNAVLQRKGQFETFVFVHNDLRGVHPTLSVEISAAREKYVWLKFELFGYTKFRDELVQLSRPQVEDILGLELPIQDLAYKLPLTEVLPLLDHLKSTRPRTTMESAIPCPSPDKLDFAKFTPDTRDDLLREFHLATEIENYYESGINPNERDEVALSFSQEYQRLRSEYSDPDEIIYHLEQYVLGNAASRISDRRGALALIGFFFQACDIFENPPPNWQKSSPTDGGA